MSVLQNNNIKPKNDKINEIYEIPAVIRADKNEISFEKALITAFILHPVIILVLFMVSFVLKLLGIDFDLFKKPELKPKDIEFVLVEKEAPPIDKNTKNRADKNSQAGGKHDPKRPVSLPQKAAPKKQETSKQPAKQAPAQPAKPPQKPKQPVQQQPKPQVQQQKVETPKQEQIKPQEPKNELQQKPQPKAPAPKPVPAPIMPSPTTIPKSNFNIPIPKPSAIPAISQPSVPVAPGPKGGSTSESSMSKNSTPSPNFSPTQSSRYNNQGGSPDGRFSSTGGNSSRQGNNVGNPGPGNPNGTPGIDAIKEPDFGPYMKELQRRIKMNWDPPKGNESKRVILLFKISKDGRLLSVNVQKSSGLAEADKAAINAVKLTAPFKPLPPEYRSDSVDIQFTFDYNVLGASMY